MELKLNDHVEHDGYMPNAYPPRKMFSSIKVEGGEVSPDNRTGGMKIIRRLAEVIKKDGKLEPREK